MHRLLPFLLTLLIACSYQEEQYGKKPENMLSQPQMIALLTDMQEAEGTMAIKLGGDLNKSIRQRNMYQDAILKKHGVSQQDFWANYQYYSGNPKLLDTIYAQVIKELEKQMPIEKERMAKNPVQMPPTPAPNIPPKPHILPPVSSSKGGNR